MKVADRFRSLRWFWVLVVWTVAVWVSRVRNVLANDDLTSGGRALRVVVVIIFVSLALGAVVSRLRQRWPHMLTVFLMWTIGYWLVRGIGILVDGGYSLGFKAVHTVLMVVSLSLSVLTARQERLGR